MQFIAKLVQVLPIQSGMGKNGEWKRQSIIVETDGMYPKKVCVTLWGDKVGDTNLLQEGNMLDISFDLESREFNGRWYTDIRAWKIEIAGAANNGGGATPASNPAPAAPVNFSGDSGDDLPF